MRIRVELCVGILALLLVGCNAGSTTDNAGRQAPTSPTEEKASWVLFKSQEGGFSISFPVEPTQKENPTPTGIPMRRLLAVLPDGKGVYSIQYADGAPEGDVREALKQGQVNMLQAQGGTLLKEEEIRLGDCYGRAFSFSFNLKSGPAISYARTFIVASRIFVLSVIGHPDSFNERDAERFLQSFSPLAP